MPADPSEAEIHADLRRRLKGTNYGIYSRPIVALLRSKLARLTRELAEAKAGDNVQQVGKLIDENTRLRTELAESHAKNKTLADLVNDLMAERDHAHAQLASRPSPEDVGRAQESKELKSGS